MPEPLSQWFRFCGGGLAACIFVSMIELRPYAEQAVPQRWYRSLGVVANLFNWMHVFVSYLVRCKVLASVVLCIIQEEKASPSALWMTRASLFRTGSWTLQGWRLLALEIGTVDLFLTSCSTCPLLSLPSTPMTLSALGGLLLIYLAAIPMRLWLYAEYGMPRIFWGSSM